jgi:hypothetical protein
MNRNEQVEVSRASSSELREAAGGAAETVARAARAELARRAEVESRMEEANRRARGR